MAVATGWFPDDIGARLTAPQLLALQKQWARYPPVHIVIASKYGYGKKPDPAKKVEDNPDEFLAMIGGFPGSVSSPQPQ